MKKAIKLLREEYPMILLALLVAGLIGFSIYKALQEPEPNKTTKRDLEPPIGRQKDDTKQGHTKKEFRMP